MSKLIAGENLSRGALLDLTGDPFIHDDGDLATNVFGASEDLARWRNIVGVAARNIRKGEVLDYDPFGNCNTADVIVLNAYHYSSPADDPEYRQWLMGRVPLMNPKEIRELQDKGILWK